MSYYIFIYSRGEAASEMVNFMSELKSGTVNGTKVKLGKLQVCLLTTVVYFNSLKYILLKYYYLLY